MFWCAEVLLTKATLHRMSPLPSLLCMRPCESVLATVKNWRDEASSLTSSLFHSGWLLEVGTHCGYTLFGLCGMCLSHIVLLGSLLSIQLFQCFTLSRVVLLHENQETKISVYSTCCCLYSPGCETMCAKDTCPGQHNFKLWCVPWPKAIHVLPSNINITNPSTHMNFNFTRLQV